MKKYYASYGTNMNFREMSERAPAAKAVGAGWLLEHELVFRYHLTIEPALNRAPCFVWEITEQDEEILDHYEGYPWLYTKKQVLVQLAGTGGVVEAMAYAMTGKYPICCPAASYYVRVAKGYENAGLHQASLREALAMAAALEPKGMNRE